ncbi:MAG TPA: TolC family protein, partial [Puia sp.]|nr:TolC family protein [Puia sp.]
MNNMRRTVLALILSNVVAAATHAQTPPVVTHAFSIAQCLDYSRQHNVQVKNAILDLQIQEQTNKGITSGALPSVTATATTQDFFKTPITLVPAEFFGGQPGTFEPVSFQPKYGANGSITVTQTIFDGQVFIGLQARRASIDLSQKAIDLTAEAISVNIHKAYFQLVVSKTQMEEIDANIARASKLFHDAGVMYQNGFAEKLDVDKANVQLANLQTQKVTTQRTINNGYLALKYLMGMPIRDSLELTDKFTEDDLKSGVLDDSAYRYENRNDYQDLEITQKLEEYNVKRYRYAYYPTLSVNASYQKNALANTYNFFGPNGTWYTTSFAGLTLTVPIFT